MEAPAWPHRSFRAGFTSQILTPPQSFYLRFPLSTWQSSCKICTICHCKSNNISTGWSTFKSVWYKSWEPSPFAIIFIAFVPWAISPWVYASKGAFKREVNFIFIDYFSCQTLGDSQTRLVTVTEVKLAALCQRAVMWCWAKLLNASKHLASS